LLGFHSVFIIKFFIYTIMKHLILFEKFDDESLIDKLDSIASKMGFKNTRISKSDKEEGIICIKKWSKGKEDYVLLFTQDDDDNPMISFASSSNGMSGNDSAEVWLKEKTWKREFDL